MRHPEALKGWQAIVHRRGKGGNTDLDDRKFLPSTHFPPLHPLAGYRERVMFDLMP